MGWENSSDVKVIPCVNEALGLGHGNVLKNNGYHFIFFQHPVFIQTDHFQLLLLKRSLHCPNCTFPLLVTSFLS